MPKFQFHNDIRIDLSSNFEAKDIETLQSNLVSWIKEQKSFHWVVGFQDQCPNIILSCCYKSEQHDLSFDDLLVELGAFLRECYKIEQNTDEYVNVMIPNIMCSSDYLTGYDCGVIYIDRDSIKYKGFNNEGINTDHEIKF